MGTVGETVWLVCRKDFGSGEDVSLLKSYVTIDREEDTRCYFIIRFTLLFVVIV